MTDRKVTFDNVKYGMMVEVLKEKGNHHTGCKVHFFNKKGVLIGNYYEFVPYEKLRLRNSADDGHDRTYQRFFYKERFENLKKALFIPVLKLTSSLIRWTQKYMD